MLVRLGNKQAIAKSIIKYFPEHQIYLEIFFGAGGMFFNKQISKYSILNDIDGDVFNLWEVVMNRNCELRDGLNKLILHEQLFYHWAKNKESDPIKKAIRFLFLSNFSYLGKGDTFQLLHSQIEHRRKLVEFIEVCQMYFQRCLFRNVDFREFFNGIYSDENHIPNSKRFAYADPPYEGTTNNYKVKWKKDDTVDLVELLVAQDIPFAISEYKTKFTEELAKKYNLELITIGAGNGLNKKSEEILLVNYEVPRAIQAILF